MSTFLGNCLECQAECDSLLIPVDIGAQYNKNGAWFTNGKHGLPGTMSNVKMSKTGKHGHAKFTFLVKYPFTGQTSQEMHPGHTHVTKPKMSKYEVQVMNADEEGNLDCLTAEGESVELLIKPNCEINGEPFGKKFYEECMPQMDNDMEVWVTVLEGPVKAKKNYLIRQVVSYCAKEGEEI